MTRLLLAYDNSAAASRAIETAAALFPGAEAVIATVKPPDPTVETAAMARIALSDSMIRDGIAHMRAEHAREARERAEQGEALATAAGLRAVHRIVEDTTPWRALRALADELAVDVIACGTRGEGAVDRVLLGSTATSLLHHAERPLLVVTAATGTDLDGPVLAGYDESEGARGALRFAASHLRARPVVVAHAWRSPSPRAVRGHGLVASRIATLEHYADELDAIWEPTAEAVAEAGAVYGRQLGLTAEPSAPESGHGDWQTLLDGAKAAHASAILVGSRGRGAVAAAVLGSVASGLVHAAALPVIVVPAADTGPGAK